MRSDFCEPEKSPMCRYNSLSTAIIAQPRAFHHAFPARWGEISRLQTFTIYLQVLLRYWLRNGFWHAMFILIRRIFCVIVFSGSDNAFQRANIWQGCGRKGEICECTVETIEGLRRKIRNLWFLQQEIPKVCSSIRRIFICAVGNSKIYGRIWRIFICAVGNLKNLRQDL